MRLRSVVLVGMAVVGVGLVTIGGGDGITVTAASIGWGLAAGFGYSAYYLVGRSLVAARGAPRVYAVAMLLGGLCLLPAAHLRRPDGGDAWLLTALVVLCTWLPYLAFGIGIRMIPAVRASLLATVEPVVAVMLAVVLASERPAAATILGGVVVVGVGILAARPDTHEAPIPPMRSAATPPADDPVG